MRPTLLAALGLLAACGSDAGDASGPPAPIELPPTLDIEGQASALFDDGATVTCAFHIVVNWDSARALPGGIAYYGRMGGESQRQVLDISGAGIALFADMGWPTAEVKVIARDSIAIDLTAGEPPSGSPYWDTFKAIEGRKQGELWSGPWNCEPFGGDVHDFMDTAYTAVGSWQVMAPFVAKK